MFLLGAHFHLDIANVKLLMEQQAMSGVRCGVQALIKKEEICALSVHCLAHSLN